MTQLTLRIDEELAHLLKRVAAAHGRSVNAYAGAVLRAAVDPDLAGDESERVRERLARAGLLADVTPVAGPGPDAKVLERARQAAGRGRPLSEFVSEGRD